MSKSGAQADTSMQAAASRAAGVRKFRTAPPIRSRTRPLLVTLRCSQSNIVHRFQLSAGPMIWVIVLHKSLCFEGQPLRRVSPRLLQAVSLVLRNRVDASPLPLRILTKQQTARARYL